jgi:DNA repair protein RecN (Recombination protein N)
MLISLTAINYTIAKHVRLDWAGGFTSITGETGAGKSVTLDALSLCLGARGNADKIYEGAEQLFVTAEFDLEALPKALSMLNENGLVDPDSPYSCIIKRVIKRNGNSRTSVNDHPVTVTWLKEFGEHLATIHGQHAYHELLSPGAAIKITDDFAQNKKERENASMAYRHYLGLVSERDNLIDAAKTSKERQQLLSFQLKELEELSPIEGAFSELEEQHKTLSHSAELSDNANRVSVLIDGDDDRVNGITSQINEAIKTLELMVEHDNKVQPQIDSLYSALAEIEDTSSSISSYISKIDVDPQHAADVEATYSSYINLARKYTVTPEGLAQYFVDIDEELKSIESDSSRLTEIETSIKQAETDFIAAAKALSATRKGAAKALSDLVSKNMQRLNMKGAKCCFLHDAFDSIEKANKNGLDHIEILVAMNAGSQLKPIGKVASGGEVSRINLVIQLINAQREETPTILFDEVDVGISGPTAAVVGGLLRELGESTQVISITHLPQVACYGHQHYHVSKKESEGETASEITMLHDDDRVQEIARLLSGETLTKKGLDNARELLENGKNACSISL